MPLPSEISFCSFLQYSPRGESDPSAHSRRITRAVKSDSFVDGKRIIPFAARRIAELQGDHQCLQTCFGPDVTLVPIPRSAPLVKGGLWPSMRLADEIVRAGLADKVDPCLVRAESVNKSATSAPGQRPRATDHHRTLRVDHEPALAAGGKICLVDDVVTRGATLLAGAARVREAFPNADICAFALIRTVSEGDVKSPLAPITGTITLTNEQTHREP